MTYSGNTDFTVDMLRSLGVKPHFFGLGFIQLKLSDEQRLHFYHPSLSANVPEEELHDHRYDFTSHVISGSLHNEIWEFSPDPEGEQDKVLVSCDKSDPVPEGTASVRGQARNVLSFTTVAGGSYFISHDRFHRVKGEECITLITRTEKVKRFATVIRGTGSKEICPFDVSLSEEDCWAIIEEMLGNRKRERNITNIVKNNLNRVVSLLHSPGYHVTFIPKGEVGEVSKILEEAMELKDACLQNARIMELIEMSDLYGAMEAYLENRHPSISMDDIIKMSNITRRAFRNGHRD